MILPRFCYLCIVMRSWFVVLAMLLPVGVQGQILFWNVENYFDTYDDPLTNDDAFTLKGEYHWTKRKYEAKRNLIAKAIVASSREFGEMPIAIGLAEVENRRVVSDLLKNTILAKIDYAIIHQDSPDGRGIDVALIYDRSRIEILEKRFIQVTGFATRDILYARCLADYGSGMKDTLHIFVNHWPSKRGGAKSSDTRRDAAAEALSNELSNLDTEKDKILIMGDFNDEPTSPAIDSVCQKHTLVNLAAPLAESGKGSIRYKGKWELIDQIIVSPAAISSSEPKTEMRLFRPPFLMENDKIFLGQKPRRTHIGPRYNGGASDHLPVLIVNLKVDD